MKIAITAALLASLTLAAMPAFAQEGEFDEMQPSEAIFVCGGPVTLRFSDHPEELEAVVAVDGGDEVVLPEKTFTGEALVFSRIPEAKSCDGQDVCIAGIFHDQEAAFDVFVDGVKHKCVSVYWSGQ